MQKGDTAKSASPFLGLQGNVLYCRIFYGLRVAEKSEI